MTMTAFRVPKKARLVRGLSAVRMVDEPNFAKIVTLPKGSKRRGLLYQERVVGFLEENAPEEWVPLAGPWFEFVDTTGHQYAQADWMAIDVVRGFICLVEIKLNRVPDAWWQLNRLYGPLVQQLFPKFEIGMLEIATTPCSFATPAPVEIVSSLTQVEPYKTKFLRVPYD